MILGRYHSHANRVTQPFPFGPHIDRHFVAGQAGHSQGLPCVKATSKGNMPVFLLGQFCINLQDFSGALSEGQDHFRIFQFLFQEIILGRFFAAGFIYNLQLVFKAVNHILIHAVGQFHMEVIGIHGVDALLQIMVFIEFQFCIADPPCAAMPRLNRYPGLFRRKLLAGLELIINQVILILLLGKTPFGDMPGVILIPVNHLAAAIAVRLLIIRDDHHRIHLIWLVEGNNRGIAVIVAVRAACIPVRPHPCRLKNTVYHSKLVTRLVGGICLDLDTGNHIRYAPAFFRYVKQVKIRRLWSFHNPGLPFIHLRMAAGTQGVGCGHI